jgi:hypothetical protein
MELDESSQSGSFFPIWPRARPPFPSCLAGSSSIPSQPGRATQRIERAVSPQFVINDLVTGVWENHLRVQGAAVCSQVLDLLKIRSPRAGLPTNLELRSADNAALTTTLTPREGMVAVLSTSDMAASPMSPQRSAEASQHANAIFYDSAFPVSPTHWNWQTQRSCVRKDAPSGAEEGRLRDDANRQQFRVALLENCSFVADLVLRQVRAERDPSRGLSEQDSWRKKLRVVRVPLTPPTANVLLRPQPEEPALPPEMPSSLPTLWVEVGCRHLQTLVSEKGA